MNYGRTAKSRFFKLIVKIPSFQTSQLHKKRSEICLIVKKNRQDRPNIRSSLIQT